MSRTLGPRSNVLLVVLDQWRFDCAGFAGSGPGWGTLTRQVRTPHMDRFAAEGTVFTHTTCPYPVCTPSRYSMLSGLYPRQHLGSNNGSTLRRDVPTWPSLLRDAGWSTAAVGKMHMTPTRLDVGFDAMQLAEQHGDGYWEDDRGAGLADAGLADVTDLADQQPAFHASRPDDWPAARGVGVSTLPRGWHSTDWVGDRAARVLEQWEPGRPSALLTSFVKPHHPFDPPAEYAQRWDPDALELPEGWAEQPDPRDVAAYPHTDMYDSAAVTEADLRQVMAHYFASIEHIDDQIGRLLEILDRRALADNTLVILTSDHGEYLGHRHLLLKNNTPYDPLIRVPLAVRWPRSLGLPAESRDDRLASLVDLPGTILSACGVDVPPTIATDRLDLADASQRRDAVFVEAGRDITARTHTHKLVLSARPDGCRLYDLAADPLETRDLYHDPEHASVRNDLEARLTRWLAFEAIPPTYSEPRLEGGPAADARRQRREKTAANLARNR
ncbi:MAG: sulfatase-like hydrolase/transferase [Planctomycetota bacterium]